jgi:RimJ/RimL family protein N-acetyltransferase
MKTFSFLDPHPYMVPRFHTDKFGCRLDEPHWGRGIATASARIKGVCLHSASLFKHMEATVLSWSPASLKVTEKIGLTREGVFRSCVYG